MGRIRSRYGTGIAGWVVLPGFGVCSLLPLAMTFGYAFIHTAFEPRFVGLENFRYLALNRYFLLGSINLLRIGGIILLIGMTLILVTGFLLDQHPRMMRTGIAILVLPLLIPSVSAVTIWKAVFRTNTLLENSDAQVALITLFLWKNAGIGGALFAVALRRLPSELRDAAALDGAGVLRTFLFVLLPNAIGFLFLALVLLVMFFLRIFKESYLLFGQYPSRDVYLLQNYMNNQYLKMNFQYVAASAILIIVAALVIYGFCFLVIRKKEAK